MVEQKTLDACICIHDRLDVHMYMCVCVRTRSVPSGAMPGETMATLIGSSMHHPGARPVKPICCED